MVKIFIIGKLGAQAVKRSWNKKEFLTFSIAHNEKRKDPNGEKQETTTWYDCVFYGNTKLISYLKKGQLVYIEGFPDIKTYQKKDGSIGINHGVKVMNVQLLG